MKSNPLFPGSSFRRRRCPLVLAATLFAAAPALADGGQPHAAPHAAHAAAQKPASGTKFATDEALRLGMASIAAIVARPAQGGAAYTDMAGQVEAQVAAIVKNCKLAPKADRLLHEILFDVNQAIGLMRRSSEPIQRTGVLAVQQALRNYARYFDHPGWTGPQHP